MMNRVFKPVVTEGIEWVQSVEQADYVGVLRLDGTPKAEGWTPLPVQRLEADEYGRPLRPVDLPWLGGHARVFRDAAREEISDLFADAGEFLELDLVDGTDRLWLFNVCTVRDGPRRGRV